METFSALLALCAGNSPVTGEFPEKASDVVLMFSLVRTTSACLSASCDFCHLWQATWIEKQNGTCSQHETTKKPSDAYAMTWKRFSWSINKKQKINKSKWLWYGISGWQMMNSLVLSHGFYWVSSRIAAETIATLIVKWSDKTEISLYPIYFHLARLMTYAAL